MWLLSLCACASYLGRTLERIERQVASAPDSAYTALCAIDKSRLSDKGDKALYNLLMSEAMYKLYMEEDNDSIITLVCQYYKTRPDKQRFMRALFMKAIIEYYGHEYPQSLITAREAEAVALSLDNYEYLAKIYEHMSDLYNITLNPEEDFKYSTLAADMYKKAGMERNYLFVSVDKAVGLANLGQKHKSIELLDRVIEAASPSDTALQYYTYEARIRSELLIGRPADAEKSYNKAKEYSQNGAYELDVLDAFEIALAKNDVHTAKIWLDSLVSSTANPEGDIKTQAALYEYNKSIGDYAKSLQHHERILKIKEDILRKAHNESVVKADRLYYSEMVKVSKIKEQALKIRLFYIVIISVIIITSLVIYHRINVKRKNEDMRNRMGQIRELIESVRSKEDNLFNLNMEIGRKNLRISQLQGIVLQNNEDFISVKQAMIKIFRKRFEIINNLCEEYFSRKDAPEKAKLSLFNRVEEQIMNMRSENVLNDIEKSLNSIYDGVMDKLRDSFPALKPSDFQFLMLTFAGFSSKAICIICNINIGNYYNKRSRLRAKIEESDSPHKEMFLYAMR